MIAMSGLTRCMRGQIFFDPIDQLGNIDRLGEKWMPLDAEAGLCLSFGDERGEKDDRRSLQFRISLNLCGYFASICFRHHYVEQDQIRPKILGTLMSLGSVVLFQHGVAACLFEKDFDQVGSVAVVINNQDASLSIDAESIRG